MRKKNICICWLLLNSFLCFSQEKPKIEWKQKVHDFKQIDSQKTKSLSVIFPFKVTGNTSLVIYKVSTTCGCTKAEWSKQPIKPNEWGQIKVYYDTKKQHGHFDKRIFVETNGVKDVYLLRIKGIVE